MFSMGRFFSVAFFIATVHGQSLAQTNAISCSDIEIKRGEALTKQDVGMLGEYATKYFHQCRTLRSKPEISIAMGEIASVLRIENKFTDALTQSQECIKYEYLSLGCHIEKALAMNALGLKSEAKEVLKTGRMVLGQLSEVASHEFAVAEVMRSKGKSNEYEMQIRSAKSRLATAERMGAFLKTVEKSMGVS